MSARDRAPQARTLEMIDEKLLALDDRKGRGLPVCSVCETNPPLAIPGQDMCGPCTFGESASLFEEEHKW